VAQTAMLAQLQAEVAQLRATVEEWAKRLGRNSRNSSQPPSADPPQTTRPRCAPSGRRPGGQPGHEGQSRAVVSIEQVDVVILLKPKRCSRCQFPLQGEDGQPQRHHVTEISSVKPSVTEYQLHRPVCPVCDEVTGAELPAGVSRGGFGPRIQAVTALCTGAYHLSRRTTPTVVEDLFGIAIGLGTVANREQATVQALAEPSPRHGAMSKHSLRRIWTKPGGVKAGNGPSCGRPPPRASPSLLSGCRAVPK
jgi:transposase